MAKGDEGQSFGPCECGGEVRGVAQFGRWFTWCTKCTPVVKVNWPIRNVADSTPPEGR